MPRISEATSFSLRGEMRIDRVTAFASFSGSARGRAFLLMAYLPPAFLSPAEWPWKVLVGANSPSLWPTISSDTRTGNELVAVVNLERQAHELRQNGRAAGPCLDGLRASTGAASGFRLLEEVPVHEGPFHTERVTVYLLLRLLAVVARPHDEFWVRLLERVLVPFVGLPQGVAPVLAAVGTATVRVVDRVAGDTARDRALTLPAVASGLADHFVHVIGVRDGATLAMQDASTMRVSPDFSFSST